MRVEVLSSVAGEHFAYGPGEYEVGDGPDQMPENNAFELLRDGIAKIVKADAETATTAASEVAVKRGRGRPSGSRNRPKPDAA